MNPDPGHSLSLNLGHKLSPALSPSLRSDPGCIWAINLAPDWVLFVGIEQMLDLFNMPIVSQGTQSSQPSCYLRTTPCMHACLLFHLLSLTPSLDHEQPWGMSASQDGQGGPLQAADQNGFSKWPHLPEDVFTVAALWEEQELIRSDHKGASRLPLLWPSPWSKDIWEKIYLFTCNRVPGNRIWFSLTMSLPEVREESGAWGQRKWEGERLSSQAES